MTNNDSEVIEHYNKIWEIKNFLSDDDINICFEKIKNIKEQEWTFNKIYVVNVDVDPELRRHLDSIQKKLYNYFKYQETIQAIGGIHRIRQNRRMEAHTDINENKIYNLPIQYGCVIYLNDDYLGGEINYPDIGLSIKPKKGSLIVHKAKYLHEILEVKSGTRYMLTTFVHGSKNTKFIK